LAHKKFPAGFDLWHTLGTNSLQIWAVFMMPLLIALETALLNGIEHSDRQWKHIFALPIPRHAVYVSKVVVAQVLIFISTLILSLLTVVVGVVATHLRPELTNAGPIPFGWFAKYTMLVWAASWLIIAIPYLDQYTLVRVSDSTRRRYRRNIFRALRRERFSGQILSVVVADESLY
jgi:hypothetical protein